MMLGDGMRRIRRRLGRWRRAWLRPKARRWRVPLGRRMERSAERMLRRKGLKTLARNYERRTGELDLVMLDGATLVFVEVRFRGAGAWTSGIGSIDQRKRQRIGRTAELYRRDHPEHRLRGVRFDVVSGSRGNYRIHWDWIRNAL